MALMLSSASKIGLSNPTASLSSALAEFENTLNEDQRLQYRATSTKPDTGSVITFVKIVDQTAHGKARRGVATRLFTFLDALQQFTGIVDTFISCNPAIAALAWGGVKTAILAASNVGRYFDEVTKMIMNIGKICPTYQSFGQLYPGCVELQSALCEYYAAIVRLCTKVIIVLQRSAVSKALSSLMSPFENEFSEHISQLKHSADFVDRQCKFASNKAAVEEAKLGATERNENNKYRVLGTMFRADMTAEQQEARSSRLHHMQQETSRLRDKARDGLATINSLQAYRHVRQQRVSTTAEWFLKDDAFCKWRDDKNGAILLCTGPMGLGKTVLISSIVEHLHASRVPTEIIAYHFCLQNDEVSLKTRTILGSIARQFLDSWLNNAQADELRVLCRATFDADSTEIVDLLSTRLRATNLYTVVLDGIDQCETCEVERLILCLSRLCRKHPRNLKIVLATRPDINNKLHRALNIKHKMLVTMAKSQSDVKCYIDYTLDQCLQDERLILSDPALILPITEMLERGAEGMFLWVRMFIEDLCEHKTDSDLQTALKSPPPSLTRLIDRKLDRIQCRQSAGYALKLLQYCGVTKRPLTVSEFRELLSLHPDQRSRDVGKLIHDVSDTVADTGGLLYVDTEEQTVHYVHHSVKNYLFDYFKLYRNGLEVTELDLYVGFLILTYLHFNDFKWGLVKTGSNASFRPMDIGVASVSYSNQNLAKVAQKLLRSRQILQSMSGKDLERKVQEIAGSAGDSSKQLELQYPFLDYARSYWLDHLQDIEPKSDKRIWSLFNTLVQGENQMVSIPWHDSPTTNPTTQNTLQQCNQAILWALAHRKPALLMHQLFYRIESVSESDQIQILKAAEPKALFHLISLFYSQEIPKESVLYAGLIGAATSGLTDCVDLYVQRGFDVNGGSANRYRSVALQAAAEGGHLEVVEHLIAAKAEVNAAQWRGRTALQAAAQGGHLNVIEYLIAAKAEVNTPPEKYNGRTALQAAAQGGYLEVVERLIAAKAAVNAAPAEWCGRTALQAAAEGGHLNVVQRLIAAKAVVNAAPAFGGHTALQAAAKGGHLDVVERLIAAKVQVNARHAGKLGRTALQAAAQGGHLEVVERLIAAKANINTAPSGSYGRTALQAAAEGGHLDVVERLIAAKAVVNALPAKWHGRTALQAAAEGGHLNVIEYLIAAKAEVNTPPAKDNGRTALQAAAQGGHLEVVERLIAAKAVVNALPAQFHGRTALQAAAEGGHLEVVERLIVVKADVNAPPAKDFGRTALQAAAQGGHLDVVERLIAVKADVNAHAAEKCGRTALQAAAKGGHFKVVERLIAAKADVNAPGARKYSHKALQAAEEAGRLDVLKFLHSAGYSK